MKGRHLGDGDILGNLLGEMRRNIWGADGKGAVEHAEKEDEAVARIARRVDPLAPDKVIRGVAAAVDGRHRGADDDGDEDADEGEEAAERLDKGQDAVGEEDDGARDPGDGEEAHEDVPLLLFEARVEGGVHRHRLRPDDLADRGQGEEPAEEVPPAGEEADDAAVAAGRDRRPMVHCSVASALEMVWRGIARQARQARRDEEKERTHAPPAAVGMAEASSAIEAAMSQ